MIIPEIKNVLSFETVYEEAGGKLHKGRGACILHGGKNSTAFSVKNNRGYCFSCGFSGDVVDFIKSYYGLSTAEAIRYLADRAGLKTGSLTSEEKQALRKARRERVEKTELLKGLDNWIRGRRDEVAPVVRAYRQRIARLSYQEACRLGPSFFDLGENLADTYDRILATDDREAHFVLFKTEAGL